MTSHFARLAWVMSFAFFGLLASVPEAARADFTVPPLTGPVVDEADVLSPGTENRISEALRYLKSQGGSQITVLTVPSLEGLEIEQASIKVTDAWKLGGAKTDNGALLMIAPKERRVRIEVGQGLEGSLTDADSKRIIEEAILPLFRSGDYDSGVLVGVYQIARKTDPNIDLTSQLEGAARSRHGYRGERRSIPLWVIIVFVLFLIFARLFGGGGGGGGRGFRRSTYYGGWGGGGWGGGGGFGGGGGGGWSGGGGGFSGGGASGGW